MELHISVRNLVEFVMRSGDIDNRKAAAPEDAMQNGTRIHRMIQRSMGSDYRAEVFLRFCYETPHYNIVIEGRADGIIGDISTDESDKKEIVIDEIKGTYKDVYKMQDAVDVHLAQAKCYAYFYATQNDLQHIRVRMTYCNMDTEEVRYFFYDYMYLELQEWFEGLMQSYKRWAEYKYEWDNERQTSIKELTFPFEYREGQKELASYVYQTIYHKKKLFVEAPTGVGKTISAVFPALKAVGEQLSEKIFYLTAKTITRTVAEDCFALLREKGLHFKTVVLTAKEKICFQEEMECNPISCPYAKGHYDRINDAIYDLLIHEHSFTRELIEQYAKKHRVCPFEMCLDMSLFSDGVICDYNYVFDPHVYLRRFFGESAASQRYIFLIDEAHNLVDRGREMYSAVLRKEDFLTLKKTVKVYDQKMANLLEKCNRQLLLYKKECDHYQVLEHMEPFILALNKLFSCMQKYLEEHDESPVRKEVLEFYFEISHFLLMYEKLDDKYVIYTEMESDGSFVLKLFCVDPSTNLQECMIRGRSSILFSATLLPIQYYKSLLGGTPEDYEVYAKSVFDRKKCGLFLAGDVTSKYTRRNVQEYIRIASYIKEIVSQKKGNYMVFFPSHSFLHSIFEIYEEMYLNSAAEKCVLQEEYMSEEAREQFLRQFTEENHEETLIGFCVLGGIFSEGIDLKKDSLIGTIIVGTGLPQICTERELMKNYFDQTTGNGFDYAYQYPGMNKVLQAAGRVIRTVDDIGIVALLDERFLLRSYQKMFPREWEHFKKVSIQQIKTELWQFWEEQTKN